MKKKLKKELGKWLAEYACGCTDVQKRRRDLLEYCGTHGDDRRQPPCQPMK